LGYVITIKLVIYTGHLILSDTEIEGVTIGRTYISDGETSNAFVNSLEINHLEEDVKRSFPIELRWRLRR
jgi:hypothetical protein